MYLEHFGLKELPFSQTPDTSYYFGLPSHVEALAALNLALESGEGLIKVVAEIGMGKTLLCRKFLNELPDSVVTAYIPDPFLSPIEMRLAVARELGLEASLKDDQPQITLKIQQALFEVNASGRRVVLVIDEAQSLPDETIEALRLFTNLESESRKLLQIVLFGQPELNKKLAQPHLRQVRQRIAFAMTLRQLDDDQVYQYVNYRMRIAGYQGQELFKPNHCRLLNRGAKGSPRLINILAHKVLMLTYGRGFYRVTNQHIRIAILDTEGASQQTSIGSHIEVAFLTLLIVASAGYLVWMAGGII